MLASLSDAPLQDPQLVYEPKYDGIRAIVEIKPNGPARLWSRLGNEKTAQFPEIAGALRKWSRRLKTPIVLDGEIVALDAKGDPIGFQNLQGRIHLGSRESRGRRQATPPPPPSAPTALIAFDVLREGPTDYRDRPLIERRARLERLFGRTGSTLLRLSEQVRGDGRALYQRALASGWEGLIAKHADSRYKSGQRSPDWHKLKIVHEQEFVIGGWTEPRQTRSYFGALLLGVHGDEPPGPERRPRPKRANAPAAGALIYVGHTGTGFNEGELARLMTKLTPIESSECPFSARPKTNERPHWVEPTLVAQIKFTEWTADGKLRHPVYLGLRDDKKPEDVRRERVSRLHASSARPEAPPLSAPAADHQPVPSQLIDQLHDLEKSRRDGTIDLPDGDRLSVTNLHKLFWPKLKLTKGDLFRYYVQVSPCLLPAIQDRPLVMKRFPNGIAGQPFYQHRAPEGVPSGVRVEHVPGDKTVPSRFIGGALKTLLYMTQLAAISQDPWFSAVSSPATADYVALDLDPPAGMPFGRVLDVARWIRDELASIGAVGMPKTSGADGLHIYIPLPPGTPYEAGLLFCQIIATVVAQKHPRFATVERSVKVRGPRIYIDYLQNIAGKTLATAYSARASDYAGASTPLTWDEVDAGFRREEFTIETLPARIRKVGDLWKALRASQGVDLALVSKYSATR